MRQAIVLVLMISLLLAGCSGTSGDTGKLADFRERVGEVPTIAAVAEITADFWDSVQKYTLSYTRDERGSRIEILEPELLRGVAASIAEGGSRLEYDGLILDVGELNADRLTPVSALPAIVGSILNGHIEAAWREEDGEEAWLCFELVVTDKATQYLWLYESGLIPARAELHSGGRVVIECIFTEWNEVS